MEIGIGSTPPGSSKPADRHLSVDSFLKNADLARKDDQFIQKLNELLMEIANTMNSYKD